MRDDLTALARELADRVLDDCTDVDISGSSDREGAAALILAALTAERQAREQAEQERDEARAFGEKAAQAYNALLMEQQAVTCAFCGEEYPRGAPRHGDGLLAEHIKTCVQHPMREVEQERDRLREALATARRFIIAEDAGLITSNDKIQFVGFIEAALSPQDGQR